MEKQQFDELLGGSQNLPRDAHISRFLSARGMEIAQITHELENPQQTKRIFQKLPAHMRRRVMSHNAKRLPRHLRDIHIKQMEKAGLPPKTKTPSRKHRRRPRNLLLEYNRRQRKKFWMETHIWHAKRFKIIDKYGFKIPLHSNDRCFRASYRAIKNHCLLQDISYYTCVELKGSRSCLLETLSNHCSKHALSFGAKFYACGEREGTLMFFRYKSYPRHPLGNVHFLWNPVNKSLLNVSHENDDELQRSVWIWIHPAFYNDIIKELIDSFHFSLRSNGDKEIEDLEIKLCQADWDDVYTMPPMFEFLKTVKTPIYTNDQGCQMTILKNNLNRFRLRGPLSLDIINDAFRCPKFRSGNHEARCETNDVEMTEVCKVGSWFEQYYAERSNAEALEMQRKTVDTIQNLTPGQLPPYMVLGLTVLDPRFYLPAKREKICSTERQQNRILEPPRMANNSPLWSGNMRDIVTEKFVPSSEIDKLRSKNLVPGVQNDVLFSEDLMRKIPIILIQKPGTTGRSLTNKSNGFATGIDIILPAAWSMPFWLALVLRCAKPGGLRESFMVCFESENLSSPDYYHDPDTAAYKREAIFKRNELVEHYFRKPPNRRVNFIKFKVAEPFFCNWDLLMKEWVGKQNHMVYRDHTTLRILQGCLNGMKIQMPQINEGALDSYLIPIKVTLINGGTPTDFATISLLRPEDIEKHKRNRNWIGVHQLPSSDPFEKRRIKLRLKHRALLKRLKRKRIRACKQIKEKNTNPLVVQKMIRSIRIQSAEIARNHIEQQAKIMAGMYLPKSTSVRFEGDRETFGYVTRGAYCYSNAVGIGIGYVVAKVLLDMIERKQQHVFVRNTTSRLFRLAKIEIVN